MTVTTIEEASEIITGYSTMIWAARYTAAVLMNNRRTWRLLVADRHAGCKDAAYIDQRVLYAESFTEDTARDFLRVSSAWLRKREEDMLADILEETQT